MNIEKIVLDCIDLLKEDDYIATGDGDIKCTILYDNKFNILAELIGYRIRTLSKEIHCSNCNSVLLNFCKDTNMNICSKCGQYNDINPSDNSSKSVR